MSKNLVIVESPAKAKTIEKFLGADYKVVASMGHIRDLPEKELGVDIEKNFAPNYQVTKEKKKVVDELKTLAKKYQEIWIATDEDREGEAIGWHLCHILNVDPKTVKRIVFHEITKGAIEASIKNPRNIDISLVDAQQARRILDRLVGYKVSPILWKKIRKGLSAGRVQSVAVKMIVEREREIKDFKPVESWKMIAYLKHQTQNIKAVFTKIKGKNHSFHSEEDVKKFFHTLFDTFNLEEKKDKNGNKIFSLKQTKDFILKETIKKDSKRTPGAPFTTSTLQQEASRKFGFSVKQTMMIAQKLYEGIDLGNGQRQGLITYMRTDSLNLSDDARNQASLTIKKLFGEKYHKERQYKTKTSGAQEAHEAIRPVDISKTPESLVSVLAKEEAKLYELIWKRTLASQMADALVEVTTLDFSPVDQEQSWITKGEIIKFDGFMKLYIEGSDDDEEEESSTILPDISAGTILEAQNIDALQAFSKPPARYTEASLVKKLEGEGIGRPSTYAPTISTIIDRGYVEKFEKKYLTPTEIAFTVTDFLEKYFTHMMNYKFTSLVENDFDKIASSEEKYETMLSRFWEGTLSKSLKIAQEEGEKVIEHTGDMCPKCGKELVYKYSKGGKFIGCTGYPECDYVDQPAEEKDALAYLREKYEGRPCPDGVEGTIVVKTGRFGPFLASSKYPEVKWIGKIKSEKDEILEEILKEKGLLVDVETGEELVVKNSKRGPFLAAKNYPDVKIAKNIPKDVWDELKKRMTE
ncbi:type I DNA topoisomerase [Candidatus Gracilibacteria bacterium]|nr:type I DNA topoisomerase [Candidatus Gracilibacteria bacterium]NUJ99179.1 type I DNA topoisomerase [Candidatus Gracilibacteria bacterium]